MTCTSSIKKLGDKLTFSLKQRKKFLAKLRTFMSQYGGQLKRFGYDPDKLIKNVSDFLEEEKVDIDCVTQQLLHVIGVFDEDALKGMDSWSRHTGIIDKYFDLDGRQIADVGAGIIPVWSIETAKNHPTSNVTAYDPEIITDFCDLPNFVAKREVIKSSTDLSGFDLGVAIQPCSGSIPFIRSLSDRDLDYYFMACLCIHNPKFKKYDEQAKLYVELARAKAPRGRNIEVIYDEVETPNGTYHVPTIISYRRKCR